MKPSSISARALVFLLGLGLATTAAATDPASEGPFGDLFTREQFTGDWGGARSDLAKKGITFDADVTQIEQGVVDGGKSGAWEYGGRADLTGHLDTQKLGWWPGGFLTVEFESNWSRSVNGKTGSLVPVDTSQLFPLPTGDNVALPQLSFAQFFSRYAGILLGKIQTITNSDVNEFAHGKGATQFFNLGMNINPVLLAVPYSTLGAGLILLPTADPHQAVVKFFVLSATGKASTSGFDDFDGAIFAGEGRVRTDFFGLTGHQALGALYSNKRYTSIDQRLGFVIENRKLVTQDGTWSVFYNFDQYLYQLQPNQAQPSEDRGVGLFGRFGASEGDPIPAQYFYSAGVGGKGLIPTRDHDQFGIGYYYSSIRNPTLQVPFTTRTFLRDEWGFEAYYNFALTPWLQISPDIQVIGPSQKAEIISLHDRRPIGTATVLGFRGEFIF